MKKPDGFLEILEEAQKKAIPSKMDEKSFQNRLTKFQNIVYSDKPWPMKKHVGTENIIQKIAHQMNNQLQEEADYIFGLTHYNLMYRLTGDKKYLDERQKYIADHKK